MTDFSNPVFSPRRARLLRYVPDEVDGSDHAAVLEQRFVDAVRAAVGGSFDGAADAGSPEQEFLRNWDEADITAASIDRLTRYLRAVRTAASDPDVVDGWFRLAEYRRRRFRGRRLFEFALTTPANNIPEDSAPLRMTPLGRAEEPGE
jgi:hypothetical protein